MAGMMMTVAALVACLGALFVQSSNAASYTVGGSSGWTIPTSNSLYTSWVAKQTFKVGDVLVFNFQTGQHTVAEVSKADYDACSSTKPISTATTGPASLTIKTAGAHYYICTVAGHCAAGQKLAVTTADSSAASPTSSTAGSPSPGVSVTPSAESPAEGPGGAAAPPSASSAGVAAGGLVLPTLLAAAAYLF